MARTIREQERAKNQTREADRAELHIAKLTIIEQRQMLRSLEARNAALQRRVRELEDLAPPRRPETNDRTLTPAFYSPHYRRGDMLRPNPSGSITLLRDTGTVLRFRAVHTWDPDKLPEEIRRLVKEDSPRVVSRRRDVPLADALKAMEMTW